MLSGPNWVIPKNILSTGLSLNWFNGPMMSYFRNMEANWRTGQKNLTEKSAPGDMETKKAVLDVHSEQRLNIM